MLVTHVTARSRDDRDLSGEPSEWVIDAIIEARDPSATARVIKTGFWEMIIHSPSHGAALTHNVTGQVA